MNLTYLIVPSFQKKQIVITKGNDSTERAEVKDHEDQPFVDFVTFCSKSLFLPGTLLFLALATSVQAQFTYLTNNGTITIIGYTGPGGAVTIPIVIDALPVTDIGTNAFDGSDLTSVTIPDSVTSIGSGAFEDCGYLTNVTISLGVTDIESNAFNGCPVLTSVTIPDSVTNIGDNAFYRCSLASVTIPDSVINIGDYAFYNCYDLTNVTIGNSVTNIGEGAFADCPQMTAINVAPANPAYGGLNGVLFNLDQTTLIEFPGGLSGSYTIPSSVTSISDGAFEDCGGLTNVIIPSGVSSIGAGAFEGCRSLANVTIPDSVADIGDYAFYDCYSLTNVEFGSGLVSIGAYAFSGSAQGGPGIPWEGCPLTSIIIPNSVATIGNFAFWFCKLTNILIGSGVTNVGEGAFGGCPLTAIDMASGNSAYSSVGGVLFNHDQSTLVEFHCGLGGSYTIPSSVTNIGDYAFYDCTSLTNVVLDNNLISIGAYAFSGPLNSSGFAVSLACRLTSITIPASVTNIGDYAFQDCESLTNGTFGDGLTSIGDYAFERCWGLTNAYFLGSAPSANSTVFLGDGLTAYYLPGTTGWAEFTTNTGVPTTLWTLPYPLILSGSVGTQSNQFGFTISWATNVPVVVEASTDLSNGVWTPIATNTLTGGASYFSDPQWTNYPAHFYRLGVQ
jgi:hypothetical protein